jgi:hypothetical protein
MDFDSDRWEINTFQKWWDEWKFDNIIPFMDHKDLFEQHFLRFYSVASLPYHPKCYEYDLEAIFELNSEREGDCFFS